MRPVTPGDVDRVVEILTGSWGGTQVVMLAWGEVVDASALPGFVAVADGEIAGLITYAERAGAVEIVTIDALVQGAGIGRALLDAVREVARERGMPRLTLITTNDNTRALRFYQRYGFDLVALHRDAVTRARDLKPGIPLLSEDGIPIRHELELELPLDS
ncbi:GNAT family N-acetyltransferase [Nonomuraea typhae]|uniref:GNAT family N-acetyltransferase n=1 Tax=Nonomuraea typhae TaxID=2603600 RepID=UPI0012FAFEB4|nr:GNAT family N-acetyltransferase [Nonomuraea typhae]